MASTLSDPQMLSALVPGLASMHPGAGMGGLGHMGMGALLGCVTMLVLVACAYFNVT